MLGQEHFNSKFTVFKNSGAEIAGASRAINGNPLRVEPQVAERESVDEQIRN